MTYQEIFAKFWHMYSTQNPKAKQIYDLLVAKGERVVNDHIALRTFSDPRVDINVLAKPFIAAGYKECGEYEFTVKKLFAKHYEHSDKNAPKVFISQLQLGEFSPSLQQAAKSCVDQIPTALLHSPELLFAGTPWGKISHDVYQELLRESEYAAWMAAYGFRANHFTINVNQLSSFTGLQELNCFLEQNGYQLNSSGGKIKGTPAECLEQSSTMAETNLVEFSDGAHEIPACYYEFAKRHPLPDGNLYSGFIAASADKIFESTDVK